MNQITCSLHNIQYQQPRKDKPVVVASMVWHFFALTNSLNETEAAIFPMQTMLP